LFVVSAQPAVPLSSMITLSLLVVVDESLLGELPVVVAVVEFAALWLEWLLLEVAVVDAFPSGSAVVVMVREVVAAVDVAFSAEFIGVVVVMPSVAVVAIVVFVGVVVLSVVVSFVAVVLGVVVVGEVVVVVRLVAVVLGVVVVGEVVVVVWQKVWLLPQLLLPETISGLLESSESSPCAQCKGFTRQTYFRPIALRVAFWWAGIKSSTCTSVVSCGTEKLNTAAASGELAS